MKSTEEEEDRVSITASLVDAVDLACQYKHLYRSTKWTTEG